MMKWWKRKSRATQVALLAGSTIILLLIVIVLLANVLPFNEVTAAWIQAAGTLVAIAIAVALPEYEASLRTLESDNERKAKAQALAVLLYVDFVEMGIKLKALSQRLSQINHRLHSVGGGLQINPGDIRLDIPPFLQQSWRDFHYFDSKTMASVAQLLSVASQYGRMLAATLPDPQTVRPPTAPRMRDRINGLRRHVIVCRRNAQHATRLVGLLHDQIAP